MNTPIHDRLVADLDRTSTVGRARVWRELAYVAAVAVLLALVVVAVIWA